MRKTPIEPILIGHLFPEMRTELLRVLESLTDEQWTASTACAGWSVKDVGLHMLADDIGLISSQRDHDGLWADLNSWEELVAFINAQNDLWVRAARRMSRHLLMQFLAMTGELWQEVVEAHDPYELAGPVGWTGNAHDPRWMHIARELTEFWMHHQHICEAVGITSLKSARFIGPVLSIFVQALPNTYRDVEAPEDTVVKLKITHESGEIGSWCLIRESDRWRMYADTDLTPASTITLDSDTAWRLFTKGIDPDIALRRSFIEGDTTLGEKLFSTVSIIA